MENKEPLSLKQVQEIGVKCFETAKKIALESSDYNIADLNSRSFFTAALSSAILGYYLQNYLHKGTLPDELKDCLNL